jgi:hypothetical protein
MDYIPEKLINKLSESVKFTANVYTALENFKDVYEEGIKTFFPEYTKHGISHVYEVLDTAANLITNDSWEIITPDDAAVLILAALLHDSAMHITEDGFKMLVQPDGNKAFDYKPIDGFKDKPWPELWADFLVEAKRFDQRKLISIFGKSDPIKVPNFDSPDSFNKNNRLLIGEFLRRTHHRLAHEIAIHGFPGPKNERITLDIKDADILNIAGLIARCHGMSLRDCFDYIKTTYRDNYIYDGMSWFSVNRTKPIHN